MKIFVLRGMCLLGSVLSYSAFSAPCDDIAVARFLKLGNTDAVVQILADLRSKLSYKTLTEKLSFVLQWEDATFRASYHESSLPHDDHISLGVPFLALTDAQRLAVFEDILKQTHSHIGDVEKLTQFLQVAIHLEDLELNRDTYLQELSQEGSVHRHLIIPGPYKFPDNWQVSHAWAVEYRAIDSLLHLMTHAQRMKILMRWENERFSNEKTPYLPGLSPEFVGKRYVLLNTQGIRDAVLGNTVLTSDLGTLLRFVPTRVKFTYIIGTLLQWYKNTKPTGPPSVDIRSHMQGTEFDITHQDWFQPLPEELKTSLSELETTVAFSLSLDRATMLDYWDKKGLLGTHYHSNEPFRTLTPQVQRELLDNLRSAIRDECKAVHARVLAGQRIGSLSNITYYYRMYVLLVGMYQGFLSVDVASD